jgi:3-deoxy-D-manno-octulosonic-acid transferase
MPEDSHPPNATGAERSATAMPLPRSGLRGWLMMGIYQPLFLLAFLIYSPVLLSRLLFSQKGKKGSGGSWRERMGFVPRSSGDRPLVWIHGVSVGEVKAASNFVEQLRRRRPDVDLVISTTTPNGRLVAHQEYPDLPVVTYPLDLANFPSRALARLRPQCVLLMELEIWPNFLQAARKRDIPVAVINGRISERTFKGYRMARGLLPQLDLISKYCVQDAAYQRRLTDLGVDPARVFVTGNMKYDSVDMGQHKEAARDLRPWLAPSNQRVLVTGSTHDDEEAVVLDALRAMRERAGAPVRTVLVPRHPERSASICDLVRQKGLHPVRWSEVAAERSPLGEDDVVVVDVIGQLQRFYAACDVAFVGGSLVPHGGQNMLEPAALGRAVIFGPHTANFRRDVELLLAADAVVQVRDRPEFVEQLEVLLGDDKLCSEYGERARRVITQNQGATTRTFDLVVDLVDASGRER